MLNRSYQRSEIYDFADLNEQQQKDAISLTDENQATEDKYVLWNNEPLPLSNFLRIEHKYYSGHYGLSAFSCYFLILNRRCTEATVVYAYC